MRAPTDMASDGFDLLRLRPVRALILWSGFPYVFQALILLLVIALAAMGWGLATPAGVNPKLYAKSNLVTLLVWGLWWPAMIWVTVFFGRAWCAICPLELVSNLSERAARRFGVPQGHLPRALASGGLIVVLYGVLQFLVAGAQIHRVPMYTSLFLIGLLLLAVVTGVVFKDRALCGGFCPVAELLATYGRGGMLAVRAGSRETCDACSGQHCVASSNRYRADARSCPGLLNPPKLNSSRDCLICGQCLKACLPDNMRLLWRRPFHPADWRAPLASWPTTLFVMLVSGFVLWELTTEWPAAEKVFLSAPRWVVQQLGLGWSSGYLNGLWALAVVPLALWLLLGSLARLGGDGSSLAAGWRRLALPVAVVVAAGQMAKALAKFVSWAGFLPLALHDPAGIGVAQAIGARSISQPAALLPITLVSGMAATGVIVSLLFSIREAKLANGGIEYALLLPKLVLAAGFVFIVVGWGVAAR